MTFRDDLEDARRNQTPVMALRPDGPEEFDYMKSQLMDDIVVQRPRMFRAEQMDRDWWWMACYFANGEQVTFHVRARCRPTRLEFSVSDMPDEWIDWDKHPEARR